MRPLAAALALAWASTAAAQPVAIRPPSGLEVGVVEAAGHVVVEARSAPDPGLEAPPDAWLGRDKALHAGGSFLMTLAGQYVLTDKGALSDGEALPVAAGATLALGLLKEVADGRRARHPHFCWRDLAADAAGVALGAAVVSL